MDIQHFLRISISSEPLGIFIQNIHMAKNEWEMSFMILVGQGDFQVMQILKLQEPFLNEASSGIRFLRRMVRHLIILIFSL